MDRYYYSTETKEFVSVVREVKSESTTQVLDWRGEGKNVMSFPYKAIILYYTVCKIEFNIYKVMMECFTSIYFIMNEASFIIEYH